MIPIIGADKHLRPYVVGSAVALVYRGCKLLVTAEHVLLDNMKVPLSIFGADGFSTPLQVEYLSSTAYDLAAILLSRQQIETLSHIPFLQHTELVRSAPVGQRFYGIVVGFPATAARRKDKITLDTRMEVYSNFASEDLVGVVSVRFDKKEGAVGPMGHVDPRDPFGKSGGAIFGMSVHGTNVAGHQSAKLVGISTRWKRAEKSIHGTSVAVLLPLLDELIARNQGSAR